MFLNVMNANIMCSFGTSPQTLKVLPLNLVMADNKPAANALDHKPMMNIPAFGQCISLANPMVAAATAASLGVLQPQPCIPLTIAPWMPGATTVMIKGMPVANMVGKAMCMWAGMINPVFAGQVKIIGK